MWCVCFHFFLAIIIKTLMASIMASAVSCSDCGIKACKVKQLQTSRNCQLINLWLENKREKKSKWQAWKHLLPTENNWKKRCFWLLGKKKKSFFLRDPFKVHYVEFLSNVTLIKKVLIISLQFIAAEIFTHVIHVSFIYMCLTCHIFNNPFTQCNTIQQTFTFKTRICVQRTPISVNPMHQ